MRALSFVILTTMSLLTACSDGSDSSGQSAGQSPARTFDFSTADAWLAQLVDEEAAFDGASMMVVDRTQGVLHTHTVGDHTPDMLFLLASVSKIPSVSLLMALADNPALDFDLDTPIENYLPFMGVYPGITTAHLLSNTSGIPGLLAQFAGDYGAHTCQYAAPGQFPSADNLLTCAQAIYQTPLAGTVAPGTQFDYGGSQWQLAGAVAEVVGGDSWNNLFQRYLGEPCGLEVYEFGNMLGDTSAWTGFADSLIGQANPNIEGGAMSNLSDVTTLLQMHLNDGMCGDQRVMSAASAQRMRMDVGTALGSREWLNDGRGYGLGWWIPPAEDGEEAALFQDGGAFGSVTWIDTARGYGAFIALAKYDNLVAARRGPARINPEMRPIIDAIIDQAQ
ncbi:MAG: serine hydrolase domain-containing protein [Halioglobus sp.]